MNTKPFNLRQALAGHPVCTRDLRRARILCYDRDDGYTKDGIVALIKETDDSEYPRVYNSDGSLVGLSGETTKDDLVLATTKKSGWINIYKYQDESFVETGRCTYESKEKAKAHAMTDEEDAYIDTVQIEWEE